MTRLPTSRWMASASSRGAERSSGSSKRTWPRANWLLAQPPKVLRTAGVHDKLTDRGVKVVFSSPEEYRRKLGIERDKWQQVVKDAGVSLSE
jgi:hypothetical protein